MKGLTDLFRPGGGEDDDGSIVVAAILSEDFQAQVDHLAVTGHLPHWEKLAQRDFRRLKENVRACFNPGSSPARATSLLLFPDWGALLFMGLRAAAGAADQSFARLLRRCADYLGNDALRRPFDALLYGGNLRLDGEENLEQAVVEIGAPDSGLDAYLDAAAAFLGEHGLKRPFNRGTAEGWTPFDSGFYTRLLQHFGLAEPSRELGRNALLHYLFIGVPEKIRPNPLFAPAFMPGSEAPGTGYFERLYSQRDFDTAPSLMFDPAHYAAFAGREGDTDGALYEDFLRNGLDRQAPFSPLFDGDYYRAHYLDPLAEEGGKRFGNAVRHYLFTGALQGWNPNPDFDSDWYLREYPTARTDIKAQKLLGAFEHFLLAGKSAGFHPTAPLQTLPVGEREAKILFLRRAIRAAKTFDPAALSFEPRGSSDISVIVPVSGRFAFTASLLRQAYFAKLHSEKVDGLNVEIIMVSNGSTDETDSVVSEVAGLNLVVFPKAIGFPRAVNAGAAVAKGDTLIILNNDIFFEPDLFSRLAKGLRADPGLGLFGAAILLPDQRLQELGSLIFADGSGFGIARGEDPTSDFAQAQMEVDYCSACAVAIARADFEAFDGLDERFSPGYYEETDLCARLKAAGRRIAVDGTIQIEHFEHGSFASGAAGEAVQTLIARHREVFRERHAEMLTRQPDRAQVTRGATLDPRTIGRYRIFLITRQVPAAPPSGPMPAALRIAEKARMLGADVEFGVFEPSREDGRFDEMSHRLVKDWTAEEGLAGHIAKNARRYSHLLLCEAPGAERFADAIRAARAENPRLIVAGDEMASAEDGPIGDLVDVRMIDPDEAMLRSILDQEPPRR
ncbi:glycosyltransferase family 2 protein [Parasphingopyxis marina]|uniref:Glycosyltransferase n=1 Tax=Parasphingopyxis marina TaxID=2761622 RepID=A0A842HUG8_9SPHN|nr:glycosyltransferase [Parasphingopyxis marina]MBC2776031.1 glycosyltransferase [Parasphingopyxis marina]